MDRREHKMITEISGLPCSGKSYYCGSDVFLLNKKSNLLFKKIWDEVRFFFIGIAFLELKMLVEFIELTRNEQVSLSYKFKIFRNIIRKFGVYSQLQKIRVDGIVDEGITHIPFNFLHSEPKSVVRLCEPFLRQSNLRYIRNSDNEVIRQRLLSRGHERLSFYDVDEFIRLNRNVEDSLLEIYPVICSKFEVINND